MGDGSGSLEDEVELALRGVGIVIEDSPESFFAGLFHSEFDGLDSVEGVFNQLGVTFFEENLEGFGVYRVLRKPMRDWSLVSGGVAFSGGVGGHRGRGRCQI